jgi:CRISPR-associated protein Cmr2
VRARWIAVADRAHATAQGAGLLAGDHRDVWRDQIDEVVEFYAIWAPLSPGDYPKVRRQVEQALAGRKNLRDFRQWAADRAGAPKSSLDGARVSVLPRPIERQGNFASFRINPGEQLDAIGVVKRVGFKPEQFIPIVNVAAAPWVRSARVRPELDAVITFCGRERAFPKVDRQVPAASQFRFDASVLYPSRWPALFEELEQNGKPVAHRPLIEDKVRALIEASNGEPPAYVACIAADGDHMGRAIDQLKDADANRTFSEKLADFPTQARKIVESDENLGSLVFAGGDDVLAFVPAARGIPCAEQLRDAFNEVMQHALPVGFPGCVRPTLSVGVAIAHVTEQMGVLLGLAREAEHTAKEAGRNRLAVIVDKRSGGRREFVLPWGPDLAKRFADDRSLLDDLSSSKIYALQTLLRHFPAAARVDSPPVAAKALRGYATDLLQHGAEPGRTAVTLGWLGIPDNVDYRTLRCAMQRAIDRLLIARGMHQGASQ